MMKAHLNSTFINQNNFMREIKTWIKGLPNTRLGNRRLFTRVEEYYNDKYYFTCKQYGF